MSDRQQDRPPEQQAIGIIQDAEAYRLAALRVHPKDAPATDVDLLSPAWFLLCHAAELALKAYLLSHGANNNSQKGGLKSRDLRHSLSGLYELALQNGFDYKDEDFAEIIDWLDPYHYGHVFRYRETGRLTLAAPWFIAEILAPAISTIKATVRVRYLASQRGGDGKR